MVDTATTRRMIRLFEGRYVNDGRTSTVPFTLGYLLDRLENGYGDAAIRFEDNRGIIHDRFVNLADHIGLPNADNLNIQYETPWAGTSGRRLVVSEFILELHKAKTTTFVSHTNGYGFEFGYTPTNSTKMWISPDPHSSVAVVGIKHVGGDVIIVGREHNTFCDERITEKDLIAEIISSRGNIVELEEQIRDLQAHVAALETALQSADDPKFGHYADYALDGHPVSRASVG